MSDPLDEATIAAFVAATPPWRATATGLVATFAAPNFVAAMQFVNAVAALAEAAQHHPDIDIRYTHVTFSLCTHDAGNAITARDTDLARQISAASSQLKR